MHCPTTFATQRALMPHNGAPKPVSILSSMENFPPSFFVVPLQISLWPEVLAIDIPGTLRQIFAISPIGLDESSKGRYFGKEIIMLCARLHLFSKQKCYRIFLGVSIRLRPIDHGFESFLLLSFILLRNMKSNIIDILNNIG
jgi:hypothetical protein